MIIKKYVGESMQQAFDAVKKDLGADAVILHTKTKKRNGILGLWGKEMVEITASKDVNIMQNPEVKIPEEQARPEGNFLADLYKKSDQPKVDLHSNSHDAGALGSRILQYELKEIKDLVSNVLKRSQYSDLSNLSDELLDFHLLLIQQHVSEDLAKEIIHRINNELRNEELNNRDLIREVLKKTVCNMLKRSDPIVVNKPGKRVAFIGPTGVGKTTTIAKLAANFALQQGKKVGLITIDTYRIAAVEQLRIYADIINIPLEVVLTVYEMKKALEKLKHCDLILIDTAGRSQNNKMQMSELKAFLDVIDPDETHLVLSTITNYQNVMDTIEKFNDLHFDKLLFTKLDEAVNFGLILSIITKVSKSMSYLTMGQNVPDDIEIGDSRYVAELLLGERHISC
ncbi:MAG: flagellar biosynthesis protein FlhF [Candidatus Omnitrophica bacterium]|nr:flagellar biosynthesis protein FlhF [Candidatus Omnitrophota bacterium]